MRAVDIKRENEMLLASYWIGDAHASPTLLVSNRVRDVHRHSSTQFARPMDLLAERRRSDVLACGTTAGRTDGAQIFT